MAGVTAKVGFAHPPPHFQLSFVTRWWLVLLTVLAMRSQSREYLPMLSQLMPLMPMSSGP